MRSFFFGAKGVFAGAKGGENCSKSGKTLPFGQTSFVSKDQKKTPFHKK